MEHAESLTAKVRSARTTGRRSGRGAHAIAWSLWAIAVGQAMVGVVLAALNRLSFERFFAEYVVSQTAASAAFATVGLLIASRRPQHTIGWLFCAIGVGMGLTAWNGQYARYSLVTQPGSLPVVDVVIWLFFGHGSQ